MKRREFVSFLSSAVVWPLAARAQQPVAPVIGYLYSGAKVSAPLLAAFQKGLGEAGYVESQNVAIEYRWANNLLDQLPKLAADLVSRRVAVITTPGSYQAALAAKAATATIPIVFSTGVDPVQVGLVASLNRPGGNVTGISSMNVELGAKRLGLLHQLLPGAARFAVLAGQISPSTDLMIADLRAAASIIGRSIEVFNASTNSDIDRAFASFAQKRI